MGDYSRTHRFEFVIMNLMLSANIPYNMSYSRVMYMTHFRKQMMFDLEIQTTHKPTDYFISGCKIRCCPDLVYSPFFFNLLRFNTRSKNKFHIFNYMRQLKYECQCQSQGNVHTAKTDCPCLPAYKMNWNNNIK